MTRRSKAAETAKLRRAMRDLQPWYEEGDDASVIAIALDACADIFADVFELDIDVGSMRMASILERCGASGGAARVLYILARASAYGEGVTEDVREELNDQVQHVSAQIEQVWEDSWATKV